MTTKPLTISITVTITMTPEQVDGYVKEYGLPNDKAATVRDDVKASITNDVQQTAAGWFWTASVR